MEFLFEFDKSTIPSVCAASLLFTDMKECDAVNVAAQLLPVMYVPESICIDICKCMTGHMILPNGAGCQSKSIVFSFDDKSLILFITNQV